VAESLFPAFAAALQLALIEASPTLRAQQKARLHQWSMRVRWLDPSSLPSAPLGGGCLFANEVLDALPVHRVVMTTEGLRERYVAVQAGDFVEVDGPLSSLDVGRQIEVGATCLGPGQLAEVSLAGPAWLRSAVPLIGRGFVLLMDYGEPASRLYGARHPLGTLRCYSRQTMNLEPLRRVGQQDLTAHVDLTAIARAGESAGAELLGVTSQEALLGRLGMPVLVDQVGRFAPRRADQWAHRRAMEALLDPGGLGRVTAMLLGKKAPNVGLTGFTREDARGDLAEALAPLVLSGAPRLCTGAISP
jgi:SAM-dependent MidA family methyltransferase